jgi:hypothetical protein
MLSSVRPFPMAPYASDFSVTIHTPALQHVVIVVVGSSSSSSSSSGSSSHSIGIFCKLKSMFHRLYNLMKLCYSFYLISQTSPVYDPFPMAPYASDSVNTFALLLFILLLYYS